MTPLEIDGAHGEGGGQLVRTAVALAAVTGRAIALRNIRARRQPPGLAPQHLAAVRAVAAVCGADCTGLALRSPALAFTPARPCGGEYRIDVGTAGSVTLVLQALVPVLACASAPSRVTVVGGTDVPAAPPLDYLREVLFVRLRQMGLPVGCRVIRRGYYPRGGGEVVVEVAPARLRPLCLPGHDARATAPRVGGLAHVANLPDHIAERMRRAALARLDRYDPAIDMRVLDPAEAVGPGGAIVAWTRGEVALGAGRVAQRGVHAERLGDEVGTELAADLAQAVDLDIHAADQLLVYLALAGGGRFTCRTLSTHAHTAIWLIEQFLPVRFAMAADGERTHVAVRRR